MRSICERPLLELGPAGGFDEHGMMPTMIVEKGSDLLLYYTGWSRLAGKRPTTMHLELPSAAMVETRSNVFFPVRSCPGRITSRSRPLSPGLSATNRASGICGTRPEPNGWRARATRTGVSHLLCMVPRWHRMDAIRKNDHPSILLWRLSRAPRCSIVGEFDLAYVVLPPGQPAISRRRFRLSNGLRSHTDLRTWHRDDAAAGIDVTGSGWDSQMVAYPCVVETPSAC